jgi:hypothetical protein
MIPLPYRFTGNGNIQVMDISLCKLQLLEFLLQKFTRCVTWVITDASDCQIHKPSFDYGHTLRIRLGKSIVNGHLALRIGLLP